MPQVCKELQREPTGTITPIDAQREEESRVVDALSTSAVNTLLYIGPRGILHYTCPRLHGKPGWGQPSLVGGGGCCVSPRPNTLLPRVLFERVTDSHPSWRDAACVDLQDLGVAEPRFLFLLTSCSSPVCAQTWKNYQQQHHCVFFYSKKKKKNILALFILKAIVYLLWEEYKYMYTIR